MRPITNSSSCNTLIDLSFDDQKHLGSDSSHVHDIQFEKTELLLPRDEFVENDLDNGVNHLYLPKCATGSSHYPIDVYLRGIPSIIESADSLLAQTPREFSSSMRRKRRKSLSGSSCPTETILNVFQGEMAHALPSQCGIMVSDDATTCHIVAIRSYLTDESKIEPLTSLTHIDNPEYEQSIREIFQAHETYHCGQDKIVQMDLHMMGGFDDADGTSRAISEYLVTLFTQIAHEYRGIFRMTFQTCAITSINDDGQCCPIGRGFGIELSTGDVFLAEVDKSMVGPALSLRFARGWTASEHDKSTPPILQLVHDIQGPYEGCLVISPFRFQPFPEINTILNLPDDIVLQYTSTSPDVEKDNFCDHLRSTLNFISEEKWSTYFGPNCDQPAIFQRIEKGGNDWVMMER